jgi:cytochrome c553
MIVFSLDFLGKNMKVFLFIILFLQSFLLFAETKHSDAVPWTPLTWFQAQKAMPKGEVAVGEKLHQELFCASCHGAKGESVSGNWPALNGQRAVYTYKQLLDYKSGLRHEDQRSAIMVTVAQMLNEQQMADLAAFYQAQSLTACELNKAKPMLVKHGDPERLLTPCAACHGAQGQGGVNETTALRGMPRDYFVRTMHAFREGKRHNDTMKGMRQFAMPLTYKEIEELADYYACEPATFQVGMP